MFKSIFKRYFILKNIFFKLKSIFKDKKNFIRLSNNIFDLCFLFSFFTILHHYIKFLLYIFFIKYYNIGFRIYAILNKNKIK